MDGAFPSILSVLGVGLALTLAACAVTVPQTEGRSMEGWQHRAVVRVVERAGVEARQFPVSFELDAASLVAEGKMRPDGSDLRLTVAGTEVPIQLEAAASGRTRVSFQVDLRPHETREDIVLHWGNPSAEPPTYGTGWGVIRPTMDGFENELLRVSYGLKKGTWGKMWGCQKEFTIKRHEEDQFGGERIPESWAKSRNDVTYWEPDAEVGPTFEVEVDGPVYKRVRFLAAEKLVEGKQRVTDLSQRVTFYRGCPFIKEEYENIVGAVVDTAVPGGMRKRTDDSRNFEFIAHEFDSGLITWEGIGADKETRGGFTADKERAERDPRYRYLGDYVYHDFLILGVVNVHNGRGIGTCADNVQTAFFVDWHNERAGYSLWPNKTGRISRYLYYVENGRGEVISRGRLLAHPPAVTLLDAKAADWGRVHVGVDSEGQWEVVLENGKIRACYRCGITNEGLQTYIREFVIKGVNESQGHWLDSAAHRTALISAAIVQDGPEVKTVRLEWDATKFEGPAVSEVSIFPDSMVLKIDYIQAAFPHICDLGRPGGADKGTYVIHGAEQWQAVREAITDTELRNHPNEHHRLTDDLYPIYPNPLIDRGWGQTPMDYNGWFIMGVYSEKNGRGFGRVVPARAVPYIKLLWGRGFEFFPHWRGEWKPYTSYLFAVSGGKDEILSLGKRIADEAGTRFAPVAMNADTR